MLYLGDIPEIHATDASAVHAMTVCGFHALQGEEVGSGLLTYPALMAADILLYQVGRAGSKDLATHWWQCDMYKGFERCQCKAGANLQATLMPLELATCAGRLCASG